MSLTPQESNWAGPKGTAYADKYMISPGSLDRKYENHVAGEKRSETFRAFLADVPRNASILEVGCNVGNQLKLLKHMGWHNVYGVELCTAAVKRAVTERGLRVTQGSARDLPYRNGEFDFVFSCWVLSHISPEFLPEAIGEMVRVSKRWIMGTECIAPKMTLLRTIPENGEGYLWGGDYKQEFLSRMDGGKLLQTRMHISPAQAKNTPNTESYLIEK